MIADLRSDTITRPTQGMREAMARAEVGDDVLGDDPTVNLLQEKVAALLGKEAALFTPSGTMANQLAVRVHTSPGDLLICHRDSHVVRYESGAPAALSGVMVAPLDGPRGRFTGQDVRDAILPSNAHFPPARLVVVENTHNRGGGTIWPVEQLIDVVDAARQSNLSLHLDGARLMNACVASNHLPKDYTRHFDTVSMCFSKGLGAPVGSILVGSGDVIRRAHRFRKMFGGGMRQAGILAAAAIYALEHHIGRLTEDHANARRLAETLAELKLVSVDLDAVETNIVFFDVDPRLGTAASVCEKLAQEGVRMLPESKQRIRAVTHLDVSTSHIEHAIQVIRRVLTL